MAKKLVCILVFAIVMTFGVSAAPFEGNITWYSFNDGTSADSGTNGYSGTDVGTVEHISDGIGGSGAIRLSGASYVEIPAAALAPSEAMTAMLWFRLDPANARIGEAERMRILSTGLWGSSAPGVMLGIWLVGADAQYVQAGIGADDTAYNVHQLMQVTSNMNDGNWHHTAVSYDGAGNGKIYYDGALVMEFAYDASQASTQTYDDVTAIGGYLYFGALYENFSGDLDEIIAVDSVLTPEQIADYYAKNSSAAETEAPVTDAPVTDAPATDAPVTDEPSSPDTSDGAVISALTLGALFCAAAAVGKKRRI